MQTVQHQTSGKSDLFWKSPAKDKVDVLLKVSVKSKLLINIPYNSSYLGHLFLPDLQQCDRDLGYSRKLPKWANKSFEYSIFLSSELHI